MNDIYKVIKLYENNSKEIIAFIGDNILDTVDNINKQFSENTSAPIFDGIFSDEELTMITDEKIKVTFSKQLLYIDDTIENIKKKIVQEDSNISFDEIYLFSKKMQTFTSSQIYSNLSKNGKITITKEILFDFLLNLNNININNIAIKEQYTFNDIIDLKLDDKSSIVNNCIGQHFITGSSIYNVTVNPLKVVTFNKILKNNSDNIITTTNKDLLMSNGFLINNTIYMCLAEDVLTNAINKELPQELITKIYFPYLNEKRINTIEKLKEKKIELLESNKQLLNKTFEKNDKNIDMFHKVYNTRKEELKYIEQGIQFIELNLSQEVEFSIPLDTIFKLIHTSKELPFIKYSASNRQENIYKLYCDKVAKNGKKIPYLSKSQIFKLIKETKGKKSVSCYMEYYVSENNENNENNEMRTDNYGILNHLDLDNDDDHNYEYNYHYNRNRIRENNNITIGYESSSSMEIESDDEN